MAYFDPHTGAIKAAEALMKEFGSRLKSLESQFDAIAANQVAPATEFRDAYTRDQAMQAIRGRAQQALAANTSEHIAPIPHNDNLSVEWRRGGWFKDAGYYVKHRTIRTRKAGPHQSVAAALDFCKNQYRAYPREVILQPNL